MYFTSLNLQPYDESLSLDDFSQLQLLLRYVLAERQRSQWEDQLIREQQRIQRAMNNLSRLIHAYQTNQYRHANMFMDHYNAQAVPQDHEEHWYRSQLVSALEQQRMEMARQRYIQVAQRQQQKREPSKSIFATPQDLYGFDAYRSGVLADVVRRLFDPEVSQDEADERAEGLNSEQDSEQVSNEQTKSHQEEYLDNKADAEKNEEQEEEENESVTDQSSSSEGEEADQAPPLDQHVLHVKNLVGALAADPGTFQPRKSNPETPNTPSVPVSSAQETTSHLLIELNHRLDNMERDLQDTLAKPLQFQANNGKLLLSAATANNRPFLTFEDAIVQVMIQLDTIDSNGDEAIRNERRSIVKKAERMLYQLDTKRQTEWEQERRKERRRQRQRQRQRLWRSKHPKTKHVLATESHLPPHSHLSRQTIVSLA